MNSQFKHIFSDVDGTLIHSKNNRPNFDQDLIVRINELHKYNLTFSIATGRHYKDILSMLSKNNVQYVNYIIGMAGAQIYDFQNKEEIFDRVFNSDEEKELLKIFDYLKENYFGHFTTQVYSKNLNSNDSINIYDDKTPLFNSLIERYLNRMKTNIDYVNIRTTTNLYDYESIYKVAFYFYDDNFVGSEDLLHKVQNELLNKFQYFDFIKCGPHYLEICLKNIDKGAAINFVNEKFLKADINSEIICFGDSDNDQSMFKLIPNSVTRGDAPESIKKYAKHIINNHPSTFVLEGIDTLVLGKEFNK